ncbi:MAG: hypothetical protein IKP54_04170 [Bacteroidales bacterium]|jgi:hypothetical protein|nr:hypothetical protein [Bacteroidales bacterium]MBR6063333.1 hypothetical protein [Bacteroidales bacterium]
MRPRFILLLCLLSLCLSSCKQKDTVVAEAYHAKLYLSQLAAQIPDSFSPADSAQLAQILIEDWIKQQIILHEAKQALPLKSQNFEKEIDEYKNTLLVNTYFNFLTSDSGQFTVSDDELEQFIKKYESRYTVNREIIKINYVKTARDSKLIKELKELLFDDDRRTEEKQRIEELCADSIEYFLEDNTWLYLDDIQNEFPIEIKNKESILSQNKYIETEDSDYHYLIVFLDYKSRRTINETEEEIAAARMMLTQQKKQNFVNQKIEELMQKSMQSGQIAMPGN